MLQGNLKNNIPTIYATEGNHQTHSSIALAGKWWSLFAQVAKEMSFQARAVEVIPEIFRRSLVLRSDKIPVSSLSHQVVLKM